MSRTVRTVIAMLVSMGSMTLATSPAEAGSVLSEFNLIVLGDLNNVTDVEGRTFVGGNLNANTSEYGTKLTAADYAQNGAALVVGGSINPLTKNKEQYKVFGDFHYNGSTLNQNNENVIGYHNFGGSQQTNNYVLNDVRDEVTQYSAYLASLTATHTATIPNGSHGPAKFDLTGATGTAVFFVDGSQLFDNQFVQQLELILGSVEHIIINVAGKDIAFSSGNFVSAFNTDAGRSRVTWNFYEATYLYFERPFDGSIIAPYATLETNHVIAGTVVVNNLRSNSEVHLPLMTPLNPPEVPVVPLPTTAWAGMALMGMIGGTRVVRRRRAA